MFNYGGFLTSTYIVKGLKFDNSNTWKYLKMKNGRTIRINDPKLQRIRNNLRLIILKECAKRQMEISDQEHALTHDKNGRYIKISEETSKVLQKLTDKWWEIERLLRASIVKCPVCGKHKKDMTYHKKSGTWFCVEHYKRQVS